MGWILFLQIFVLTFMVLAVIWSIVSEVMDKKVDMTMIAAGFPPARLRENG